MGDRADSSSPFLGAQREAEVVAAAAVFLKVGRPKTLPSRVGESAGPPGLAPAAGMGRGLTVSVPDPRGGAGQDMAMVRLSPEKGHSGAPRGCWGPPGWLTGACPAPPTRRDVADAWLLLLQSLVGWGRGSGCVPDISCSLRSRSEVESHHQGPGQLDLEEAPIVNSHGDRALG